MGVGCVWQKNWRIYQNGDEWTFVSLPKSDGNKYKKSAHKTSIFLLIDTFNSWRIILSTLWKVLCFKLQWKSLNEKGKTPNISLRYQKLSKINVSYIGPLLII